MDVSLEKKNRNSRLGWLDFGKAVGILVVLMVHTGGSFGLLSFYGGMFYMPVFFVAAGYTYRCRKEEPFGIFVKKKVRRLLIPYFGTSAFLWLFFWVKDCVLAGNPGDLKLASVFGILYSRNQMYTAAYSGENPVLLDLLNAPLWFLTAMFLTYLYYEILSRSKRKYVLLGLGVLVSVLIHYGTPVLLPWSLEAVPYFACFFGAGEWLKIHDGVAYLKKHWYWNLVLLVLFVLLSRINGSVNLSCGNYGRSMLLYLVVGNLGSVLVFMAGAGLERLCPPLIRLFGLIGQETLWILCLHMFLYMFLRTAAGMAGLGEGATCAVLIFGSAVALTGIGRVMNGIKCRVIF